MNDDDLIIEANELFDRKKPLLQDVNRCIRRYCRRLTKDERKAIHEAGRAGFVLGFLEGVKRK